jgi:hypothetical protein
VSYDLKAIKDTQASAFARTFLEGYLAPAFGARSKSEIDLLVFSCLINAKLINPEGPIYEIARGLNITPARARGLLLNWQLRSSPAGDMRQAIVAALQKTRFSADGSLMTFGVESPLLKEEMTSRLRATGVFPDASFSKELVRMRVEAFVEFLDSVLDEEIKKGVKAVLVKDKLLPDRSFKALATGVLKKLGEKVAGESGGAVAKGTVDKVSSFIGGLLNSDVKGATKSIGIGDYIDV